MHPRISRLAIVLVLGACGSPLGQAQLSPGPLSKAHQDLDSPLRCTQCHVFGAGEPVFVCAECHTEIADRVKAGSGYHATVVRGAAQGRDCAECHREHVGRDFKLVHWPGGRDAFDHAETGYPLVGAHAEQRCADCHKPERIERSAAATLKVKDLSRTFLGLRTTCRACHADEHQGQLGGDCGACHTFESWTEIEKFDHQQTAFPLTGRHETVECVECHTREDGYAKYKGHAFGACATCHEDPHDGAFPYQPCENCHSTFNWSPGARFSSNFDHSRTSFALNGKHAEVGCTDCHSSVDFSEPMRHERCLDCHEDAHDKQFDARDDGGDCAACHNEDGFAPTTFSREQHAETDYPLTGKHADLECKQCHEPRGEKTLYRVPAEKCLDCHEDEHDGEFAAEPYRNRCEECHSVDGFHPSSFSVTRHQDTQFALAGSHLAVSCAACHVPEGRGADAHSVFRFDDLGCPVCHEHPHGEQFAGVAKADRLSCESCHDLNSWTRLRPFPHENTDFPLLGAHRTVGCSDCHTRQDGAVGFEGVVFSEAPQKCAGCHEDVHDGQFDQGARAYGCSTCHTNDDWKPTQFDHDQYSVFDLDGAHEDVPCKMCHTQVEEVDGLPVRIYRGTPDRCVDCHSDL